jgi:hypothetical protein
MKARLWSGFVYFWTIAMALLILLVTVLQFRQPDFSLGLGLVQAGGLRALMLALALAVCEALAVVFLIQKRRLGGVLQLLYSVFFLVSIGGDLLRDLVQSARRQAPLDASGDIALTVIMLGFLLSAAWSWRRAFPR